MVTFKVVNNALRSPGNRIWGFIIRLPPTDYEASTYALKLILIMFFSCGYNIFLFHYKCSIFITVNKVFYVIKIKLILRIYCEFWFIFNSTHPTFRISPVRDHGGCEVTEYEIISIYWNKKNISMNNREYLRSRYTELLKKYQH